MNPKQPPSLATWMLEHLVPGERNEALDGDLLEEFHCGRSTVWYWRQALAAIAIGCLREILIHRTALLFAALWSMLAPAWLLIVANIEQHYNLGQRFWQMDWPWSTLCDLGLLLGVNVLFIWIGIVLYLLPDLWVAKSLGLWRIGKGILASLPVLFALWLALIVLSKIFLTGQVVDQHSVAPASTYSIGDVAPIEIQQPSPAEQWDVQYGDKVTDPYINPRNAILDMRTTTLFVRLPFFLCLLCTLWGISSHSQGRRSRIIA